ncbi:MAG: extracellular solute-binding protein [Bacilli bacterium]|nr:extracellular solute-binding protein [Bacilli bacterium]
MKKILCIIALLFASVSLAACGGNDSGVVEGKTTITFWHAMGQANQAIIQEMIDSFEQAYPMFEVEQLSQGGYTDLRDKILYSVPVGEAPTIAQAYPDHIASYLSARALTSLEGYIDDTASVASKINYVDDPSWAETAVATEQVGWTQADKDDFVSAFYAEGSVYGDGKMYCVPFNKSTEVLFYNKDFFQAYATELAKYGVQADGTWRNPTWEQIEGIAAFYKTTAEYNSLEASLKATAAGFSADSEANLFITLTQQWGGKYTGFDANGKGQYLFNNAESKEAIGWFAENYEAGLFGTSTRFGTDYSSDAFKAMQCIMTIGSSAGASYNTTSNFVTGVAEYPQRADGQNKNVIQQGTNVCLFDKDNDLEELGGWLFMKWMTNFDNALLWCTETAYFPIRESVYNSAEFQASVSDGTTKSQAQLVGWSQQELFYTSEAFNGSSKARDEAEALVRAILVGTPIDEAYATAIKNCNALV